jgi:hypothetical protein
MKPRVSILSPDFKYVRAVCTDLRRTFARIRREQREQAKQQRLANAANALIRAAAANDAASSRRPSGASSHPSRPGVASSDQEHFLGRRNAGG